MNMQMNQQINRQQMNQQQMNQPIINQYNLIHLRYLYSRFFELIGEYGKCRDTVIRFKELTNEQLSLGNVSAKEVKFIERVLGMENTNDIKWKLSEDYLTDIMLVIEDILGRINRPDFNISDRIYAYETVLHKKVADIIKEEFKARSSKTRDITALTDMLNALSKRNMVVRLVKNGKEVGRCPVNYLLKKDSDIQVNQDKKVVLPSKLRQAIINSNVEWVIDDARKTASSELGTVHDSIKENLLKAGFIEKLDYIDKKLD